MQHGSGGGAYAKKRQRTGCTRAHASRRATKRSKPATAEESAANGGSGPSCAEAEPCFRDKIRCTDNATNHAWHAAVPAAPCTHAATTPAPPPPTAPRNGRGTEEYGAGEKGGDGGKDERADVRGHATAPTQAATSACSPSPSAAERRRALSFDVGSRHMACAVVSAAPAPAQPDDFCVEHMEVADIIARAGSRAKNANRVASGTLTRYVEEFLTARAPTLVAHGPLSVILIECQPGAKYRVLAAVIQTFFAVWYPTAMRADAPPIVIQSAAQKLRVRMAGYRPRPPTARRRAAIARNGGRKTKGIRYAENKEHAVDNMHLFFRCYPRAASRATLAYIASLGDKQDDVADALLQAVFWLVVGSTRLPRNHTGTVRLPILHGEATAPRQRPDPCLPSSSALVPTPSSPCSSSSSSSSSSFSSTTPPHPCAGVAAAGRIKKGARGSRAATLRTRARRQKTARIDADGVGARHYTLVPRGTTEQRVSPNPSGYLYASDEDTAPRDDARAGAGGGGGGGGGTDDEQRARQWRVVAQPSLYLPGDDGIIDLVDIY